MQALLASTIAASFATRAAGANNAAGAAALAAVSLRASLVAGKLLALVGASAPAPAGLISDVSAPALAPSEQPTSYDERGL